MYLLFGRYDKVVVPSRLICTMFNTAIQELIKSYYELNGSSVDELTEQPSPLEFMRYVASNRPFVIRGSLHQWGALQKWNMEYLKSSMADKSVKVAITPTG